MTRGLPSEASGLGRMTRAASEAASGIGTAGNLAISGQSPQSLSQCVAVRVSQGKETGDEDYPS
jgi:hypothetical protein